MMMKKFMTILFFTILSIVLFSMKVNADKIIWDQKSDRSIALFLSIEGSDLHIYSDKQWDNIGIQMIDPNGRTIYVDVIIIPAEEELIIPLSDISKGDYQVILTKNNQPVTWYLTK